jgi:DNA-binding protein H-NS
MTSAQTLRQQLADVEAETAKSVKAAKEKMLALEAQIKKEREQELLQAAEEIQAALKKYNITIQEALSIEQPAPIEKVSTVKGSGSLAEVREYYNNNP